MARDSHVTIGSSTEVITRARKTAMNTAWMRLVAKTTRPTAMTIPMNSHADMPHRRSHRLTSPLLSAEVRSGIRRTETRPATVGRGPPRVVSGAAGVGGAAGG